MGLPAATIPTQGGVPIGQAMPPNAPLCCWGPGGEPGFETVDMGDSVGRQGRVKVPRRIVYFASGETMEEYSTDEEEEEEEPMKKDVIPVDPVG
eukprot:superscaffoldBa00001784_g12006